MVKKWKAGGELRVWPKCWFTSEGAPRGEKARLRTVLYLKKLRVRWGEERDS